MAATKVATSPRRRLTADAVAGAITLVLGGALTVVALGIQPSSFGNAVLQPRDLPLACGIGLLLAGAVLLAQGLLEARRDAVAVAAEVPEDKTAADASDGPAVSAANAPPSDESAVVDDPVESAQVGEAPVVVENKRNVLALGVLLFGYLATFIPLGYVPSTMAFLFIGSTYFSPGKPRRNILFSVLLSVGVYVLFTEVLGIVLPKGILEPIL